MAKREIIKRANELESGDRLNLSMRQMDVGEVTPTSDTSVRVTGWESHSEEELVYDFWNEAPCRVEVD